MHTLDPHDSKASFKRLAQTRQKINYGTKRRSEEAAK